MILIKFNVRDIPFVHGSFNLSNNLNSILKKGLLPYGKNIREIDKVAGNGKCISLRLARVHANFGDGKLLIIDPAISDKTGVRFYTNELYGIGNDIRRHLYDLNFEHPDRIYEINKLKQIIASVIENENTNNGFKKLLYEPQFKLYLSSYILSKENFYRIFEEKCQQYNISLQDFYKRTPLSNNWMINEDICIPDIIEPKYILGYWNGEKYKKFKRDINSSIQLLIDRFISSLEEVKAE